MRLIGSKTEADIRAQLVESHRALFFEPAQRRLLDALRKSEPAMKTAYILGWTPEESSDIFDVLVDIDTLLSIELERVNDAIAPLVSRMTLVEYTKTRSRPDRIRLAVAQQLAAADIGS